MHQNYSLQSLRNGAAALLSLSIQAVFPDAKIIASGVTPLAFFVDVCFPFDFQEPLIVLLEEKMRSLAKSKVNFVFSEMVPVSAAAFFRNCRQEFLAAKAEASSDILVGIVQQAGCAHLVFFPLEIRSFEELKAFKVKGFEKAGVIEGKPIVRLWGAAHQSKDDLKEFLRKEPDIVAHLHQNLGAKDELFFEEDAGFFCFFPKAQAFLEKLAKVTEEIAEKDGCLSVCFPKKIDLIEQEQLFLDEYLLIRASEAKKFGLSRVYEDLFWPQYFDQDRSAGLITSAEFFLDVQYIFVEEDSVFKEVISSLQSISEILKILGFQSSFSAAMNLSSKAKIGKEARNCIDKICLELARLAPVNKANSQAKSFDAVVDFFVEDALDRPWKVGGVKILFGKEEKCTTIVRSVLGFRQRMMALLLEKHKKLPEISDPWMI